MSLDVLVYRIFRLWKVIVLGVVFPLATVWTASIHNGSDYPVLMTLAVLIPGFHAIRYPGMWQETLIVSLILSLCLWLATMIEPGLTTGEMVWRVFWLIVMAFVLFLGAITPVSMLTIIGPKQVLTARAVQRSRLDADSLRAALPLFPGKVGPRINCGPADEEGRFSVTIEPCPVETVNYEIQPEYGYVDDDDPGLETVENENASCTFHAVVHDSGPGHHEIFTYFDPGEIGVQRHTFKPLKGRGTEVTVEETGHRLPVVQIFGFWLIGYMADHLTHELDMAEGRTPRANRAFPQKQLVVDIANFVLPFLGGTRRENTGA